MSSEMAVKCPICGSPYRPYSHYAGDQSACPDCRARARGRTVDTLSTSPEVTYGYYACDKCLSQREFIRGGKRREARTTRIADRRAGDRAGEVRALSQVALSTGYLHRVNCRRRCSRYY